MLRFIRDGFLNPYFQIFFGAIIVTAAELCLKVGAVHSAQLTDAGKWAWTGIAGLLSPWIWCAIVLMVTSLMTWLYVLRHLPLAVAYPISNMVHIFVPLSCWWFLGETISLRRWCGILLVLIGLVVVSKPFSRIEDRL